MSRLLATVAIGLGLGSIYTLLALGFVIIFKSTRVISFAQPGLMLAGGIIVHYVALVHGLGFWPAVGISMAATALIALVVERLALRPMVGEPVFVVAIITLGVDIVIRVIVNKFIGVNVRPVGDPWGRSVWDLGGVVVEQRFIWFFVITMAVVAALMAFFKFSRIGLAMRATAFDQETALTQGVSVGLVFALSWAIAGALAALAGTFVGSGSALDQGAWVVALKGLPAIILGGLDSIGGAVVGGLAIGVVEALFATYQGEFAPWLGNNFSVVSPYLVMLIVLLLRPYGLWGTPEIERV